jgi:Plasmid replication region DNA-binding N-term
MDHSPSRPKAIRPPPRGITQSDVSHAADSLLRAGMRPTIEKIRQKLGRGSPNTINPMLDAWWKTLSARLDAGPTALHRLPETVAHVAEALWMQALEEGKRRAALEQRDSARIAELDKQRLEVRSHVLTLREGELDSRLRDRDRTIEDLNLRLRELTGLLGREQATRESLTRRLTTPAPSSSSGRAIRAPALARQRRVKGVTSTRLPESRPERLSSVAASLPQNRLRKKRTRTPLASKLRKMPPRTTPRRDSAKRLKERKRPSARKRH